MATNIGPSQTGGTDIGPSQTTDVVVYVDMDAAGGGTGGGSAELYRLISLSASGGGTSGGTAQLESTHYVDLSAAGGGIGGGTAEALTGPLPIWPVELVTIAQAGTTWRINNSVDTIVVSGLGTFTPQTGLSRGDVGNGADPLDIVVSADNVFVLLYRNVAPGKIVTVTVYWLNRNNNPGSLRVLYKGMVKSVTFSKDGQEASIHLESILSSFDKEIPNETFSPQCQNFLYDEHCLVNPEDFKHENVVTAVSGTTLTVTNLSSKGAGWAVPGFVKWGTEDYRQILSQSGDDIELLLPFGEDLTGETVAVYAGCNHEHATDCIVKFSNGNNYRGCPFVPTKNPFKTGIK